MNESQKNIREAGLILDEPRRTYYEEFMNTRFPEPGHYTHLCYAEEWAERFKNDPMSSMDKESKRMYLDIITNVGVKK